MIGFRLLPGAGGVFRLEGELDVLSAEDLDASLAARLNGQVDVVFDLSNLSFIDSAGIRALIRVARQVAPRQTILRDPQPHVVRVLEIVRIQDFGVRVETEPPESSADELRLPEPQGSAEDVG
jgi:anti-sigma B factor antagonist